MKKFAVSVARAGPPLVITKTKSNILMESMNRRMKAMPRIGRSRGTVMYQKALRGPAPSIFADSYGSVGSPSSPARHTRKQKGVHCQTSVAISAYKAVRVSPNQAREGTPKKDKK